MKRVIKLKMPENFAEIAVGMRTIEVMKHYGICYNTARKWFDAAGIKPKRLYKPGKRPKGDDTGYGMDSPEQRERCLNCKKPRCSGICKDVNLN